MRFITSVSFKEIMTHKLFKSKKQTNIMGKKFNVLIEQGEDGFLIATVLELAGCRTQAKTYDELLSRTKEAIELFLLENKEHRAEKKFLGLQQIEVEI